MVEEKKSCGFLTYFRQKIDEKIAILVCVGTDNWAEKIIMT
jgi:hypothetical protein